MYLIFKWHRIYNLICPFSITQQDVWSAFQTLQSLSKMWPTTHRCILTVFSVFRNGFKHRFCLTHIMPMKIILNLLIVQYVCQLFCNSCCSLVVYWLSKSLFSYQHHLKKFITYMYITYSINFDVVQLYVHVITFCTV